MILWALCLSACVFNYPAEDQLNTLIGKNYSKLEARCPQCFDDRLRGTADGMIYLPDGRMFRVGEPNPTAIIYRETPSEIEYLRIWKRNCTYVVIVRKSDGIITSWHYVSDDRGNCYGT
jgi:hypothetical protein